MINLFYIKLSVSVMKPLYTIYVTWQNECEWARSNFELRAKEVKNVCFGGIKYLKWSLFVRFLRGVFLFLDTLDDGLMLLLTTSCESVVAKSCIPEYWEYYIEFLITHDSKPVKYDFQNTCWWKQNDCADWHLPHACIRHVFCNLIKYIIVKHVCVNLAKT